MALGNTAPLYSEPMPSPNPYALFLKLLHRALQDQARPGTGPREAQKSQEALEGFLPCLGLGPKPVELRVVDGGFTQQGRPVRGAPEASRELAMEMAKRGLAGLAIQAGADAEDLRKLVFILQLAPGRLVEMGGPAGLLPEDGNLWVLAQPAPQAHPAHAPTRPEPVQDETMEVDWNEVFAPPTPRLPLGTPRPPTRAKVEKELQALFQEALLKASPGFKPGPRSPWGIDQREALLHFGFQCPDFRGLLGTGSRLGLDALGPTAVRAILKKVLAGLEGTQQANVLLGLPAFPPAEHALRQALGFLAPELLGRAVAEVWLQHRPSLYELPLLALALMHAVPDWDLALDTIEVHLQCEGWSGPDLAAFREALQWEGQGTDTKLRLSLHTHGVHRLDPHLVMILGRSLLRSGRLEDLASLLTQLETELLSPKAARKRHGAEILADLASALPEAGLPLPMEDRLLKVARDGLATATDAEMAQGCAQAMAALVEHWLLLGRVRAAYGAMRELRDLAQTPADAPPWRQALVGGLLGRLVHAAQVKLPRPAPAAKAVFSVYRTGANALSRAKK